MPQRSLRVLVIEDNSGDVRLIRAMLAEASELENTNPISVTPDVVDRLSSALERIKTATFDAVLLDLGLPDTEGIGGVLTLAAAAPELPIIVMSGREDGEIALRAVHEGAQDYLVKGRVDSELLRRAIGYAIERKRVEVERLNLLAREREARAAAEGALRTRDQVLSTVSHDLRTPIAAIGLYARALQASRHQADVVDVHAQRISKAARDGLEMIQELLDVARLGMGQEIDLELRRLDLSALVREAVIEQQQNAPEHLMRSAGDAAIWGIWDRARVKRVVANLLSNATKYSPAGSQVWISVSREAAAKEPLAVLSVRDEGLGIPEADVPRIFDWYHRAGNVGNRKGTGIGLSGSLRIVQLHGGSIEVETREGAGSTFTVRLPIRE